MSCLISEWWTFLNLITIYDDIFSNLEQHLESDSLLEQALAKRELSF